MDALRDWGHARDYVRMQWLMLQQDVPKDYVIATGKQISVRDFVRMSCKYLGIEIKFNGEGVSEVGVIDKINNDQMSSLKEGDIIIKVDPRYFRPAEVETLIGNPDKAKNELGWVPEISVEEMCKEMVDEDRKYAKETYLLNEHGFNKKISKE